MNIHANPYFHLSRRRISYTLGMLLPLAMLVASLAVVRFWPARRWRSRPAG